MYKEVAFNAGGSRESLVRAISCPAPDAGVPRRACRYPLSPSKRGAEPGRFPPPRLSQHEVDFQRSRFGAEVMTNLRATVIMKTDMSDSTARLRQLPESD